MHCLSLQPWLMMWLMPFASHFHQATVADDVADAVRAPLSPAVADDVAGSVRVSLPPVAADDVADSEADDTKRTRTIARTPSAETTSSGVNKRWYVITVGRETGVFQGWHNIHTHVIGVPGACFGHYSSRAAADTAYMQALRDGSVSQLLD
ncbi:uncharacterized protein HD556DRAFT_1447199 [Suillus plorans]|uniref:Ribonuclease H1 N-terminal domain-containing protein n=1 Tax=Suillus plorans TaxID=116603 RepID=A0A9P7AHV0_9AGAM|nr:uncharacterized protein HD556DRAFT_1447199 [Suillus plorans]KAG1789135.1 hypothetical protein HD556DRAFT_1447199 [Suillus plorans]